MQHHMMSFDCFNPGHKAISCCTRDPYYSILLDELPSILAQNLLAKPFPPLKSLVFPHYVHQVKRITSSFITISDFQPSISRFCHSLLLLTFYSFFTLYSFCTQAPTTYLYLHKNQVILSERIHRQSLMLSNSVWFPNQQRSWVSHLV